jgi:cellulose synthase/poly-beta-1,6-N-acetylglucosamine synthase-like glycosyltransferase
MSALRLSVVIPVHNAAPFLAEALDSVYRQTTLPAEVIVVDDGSTDGSAAVAARWPVTLLTSSVNYGPAAARNAGIRAATGDVVAFLDADDVWHPTHCASLLALLEAYPEAVVAGSRSVHFGEAAGVSPMRIPAHTPASVLWSLVRCNEVRQSTAVVRRWALREVGGYNESLRYAEDYDLWLRLARRFPFVGTDEVTASYRVHPGQATKHTHALTRGRWRALHSFWVDCRASAPAEVVRRLEEELADIWERELVRAWWACDAGQVDLLLSVHDCVPGCDAALWRWRQRRALLWRPWNALSRAWDTLHPDVRAVVRPVLRPLRPRLRGFAGPRRASTMLGPVSLATE